MQETRRMVCSMIPFIKSIEELMVITDSRSDTVPKKHGLHFTEESGQRKRYLHSISEEQIALPDIPKKNRLNWVKSKKAIKRFFDDLDYNNQNISTYDITLMKKQEQKNYHDAA